MEEEVIVEKNLTVEDLDKLLEKYFTTVEQQKKEQELIEQEKESQVLEVQEEEVSSIELQKELITEIRTLKEYTQYSNNLDYLVIVVSGAILICVLMYKFLKIFM